MIQFIDSTLQGNSAAMAPHVDGMAYGGAINVFGLATIGDSQGRILVGAMYGATRVCCKCVEVQHAWQVAARSTLDLAVLSCCT